MKSERRKNTAASDRLIKVVYVTYVYVDLLCTGSQVS